jgi:hypothetical protein
MLNQILDPNNDNYKRDKTRLWNFFAAYYATLMSFSHQTTEDQIDFTGV